jgi:TorA maturation chaperone TorD
VRDGCIVHGLDAAGGLAQPSPAETLTAADEAGRNELPTQRPVAGESEICTTSQPVDHNSCGPRTSDGAVDPVDLARAQEYALLAALLQAAPSQAFLDRLALLRGDSTPLGLLHEALAEAASRAVASRVEREYFGLFVGLGRGELLPYASYYLTGFLNERPLSRLRADLTTLGIERVESNCEPEDHAATLCEIMAGLAAGGFPASADAQRAFFEKHVSPWMGRLFADIENAASANFYRSVGTLGRVFLEIEAEALTLAN